MPSNENATKNQHTFFFPSRNVMTSCALQSQTKPNRLILNYVCRTGCSFVVLQMGAETEKKTRKIYDIHTVTGTNHSIQFISSCVDRNKNMKNINVAALLFVHFFFPSFNSAAEPNSRPRRNIYCQLGTFMISLHISIKWCRNRVTYFIAINIEIRNKTH